VSAGVDRSLASSRRVIVGIVVMGLTLTSAGGARAGVRFTNQPVQTNMYPQNETSVAISRNDDSNIVVAYNDGTPRGSSGGNCGYAYTTNGGSTWHRSLKGLTKGNGGKFDHASDPGLAYSAKQSRFYFVCEGSTAP
jgi:hypothetical protein